MFCKLKKGLLPSELLLTTICIQAGLKELGTKILSQYASTRELGFRNLTFFVRKGSNLAMEEPMSNVIFDLDGTLLDTERIVDEVCEEFLVAKYGKQWDGRNPEKRLGKKPLQAAAAIVEDYELPCTPEQFLAETVDLVRGRFRNAKALPGANRLLKHLVAHKIPIAIGSNSYRSFIAEKLAPHSGWAETFPVIVAGDEVQEPKPSPQIFLEAAKQLDATPSRCLVIEDSPTGITAGKAAGMKVVAVPSLPSKASRHLYASADHIISSLLDFKPELWGLPPFQDWIANALPIEPWYISGPVIRGFGRGSKVLGIPTANLPTGAFSKQLAEQVCGIYLGWARLSDKGVFKMVMSVGWNPYFDNAEKTVEPWLLHEFPEDFYGEELRLIVVGYIRPEANFSSLEDLINKIHEDGRIAKAALDVPPYSAFKEDKFLQQ
ncbi:bifunctional riboflavin kinase/FMN phosphatase isoform X1 [Selaginella moellendorffii]|uniref:bifunctional riboflavin kinase/FMN phosphatase isoform X1 n=1 Tax=Selaginella moellendorffii TaxID=88036 RepID=UPI000D1CF7C7|nr:bifunctional riboflavin kinase/FMN phosphatase isoform X1 [Selaginella moellendorffii]|eukprot:XP_024537122.1 bifunctional riboflavin kinase/FMN phosphatase isoform X1 [Selaginella moellendorffii]